MWRGLDLVQRQYHDSEVKPRTVLLGPKQPPPVVIYMEAQRLGNHSAGYILLRPELGGAASVKGDVLATLCELQTQIMRLEALADQAVCSSLAKRAPRKT